jgi:hypothetical protein
MSLKEHSSLQKRIKHYYKAFTKFGLWFQLLALIYFISL